MQEIDLLPAHSDTRSRIPFHTIYRGLLRRWLFAVDELWLTESPRIAYFSLGGSLQAPDQFEEPHNGRRILASSTDCFTISWIHS